MARARFSAAARRDLGAIIDHLTYESGSSATARAFARKIQQKCDDLAALKGTLGTARWDLAPDIRSFPFRSYVIFFRYDGDVFRVISVLHGQRDALAYFESRERLKSD